MPFTSQKQRALMYATAAGAKTGVPKKVAKEMIAKDKPGKLPEKAPEKKKPSRAKALDATKRPERKM